MTDDANGPRSSDRHGSVAGTVVIPTRDRHRLLARCLESLSAAHAAEEIEVIVVDDGSRVPVTQRLVPGSLECRILRLGGVGPGTARNAGVHQARAPVVLFTDDDAEVGAGWVESALTFLTTNPDCVGVNGPVASPKWDPLYELSMASDARHHYWTCNVAYRRMTFLKAGGFRGHLFPNAHGEDIDLGMRMRNYGPIGYEAEMRVLHSPRCITVRDVVKQGRWAQTDLMLYALYPELTQDFTLPVRPALVKGALTRWTTSVGCSPNHGMLRRVARAALLAAVNVAATTGAVLVTPPGRNLRRRYRDTGTSGR